MNTKMLALLIAGLTLLSVSLAGCSDSTDTETGTDTGVASNIGTGTATNNPYESGNPDDPGTSPIEPVPTQPKEDETLEPSPVFTDVTKTAYVYKENINIRSATSLGDNVCGNAVEGDLLEVTGESKEWYRIKVGDQTCYITKNVACDKALIDDFTAVSETATVNVASVYIRTAPLADNDSTKDNSKTTLAKGTVVTLTGVNQNWARISYEGKTRYVALNCISRTAATTESSTEVETPTEAASANA